MKKKIFFKLFVVVLLTPLATLAADFASSGSSTLDNTMKKLFSTALGIGTPIVIIGWVIAGILYLTSSGEPQKMETAKKAMIACVIGTVLIALAYTGQEVINMISNALGIQGGGG